MVQKWFIRFIVTSATRHGSLLKNFHMWKIVLLLLLDKTYSHFVVKLPLTGQREILKMLYDRKIRLSNGDSWYFRLVVSSLQGSLWNVELVCKSVLSVNSLLLLKLSILHPKLLSSSQPNIRLLHRYKKSDI